MFTRTVFISHVSQAMLDRAVAEHPFLKDIEVPFISNSKQAIALAKSRVNKSLPTHQVVTEVSSVLYNEVKSGWDIDLKILD